MSFHVSSASIVRIRFKLSFQAALLLAATCLGQITGRVVDPLGKPVANATITYTNLANRLVWAFSGPDGRFSLADPAKTAWGSPIDWLPAASSPDKKPHGGFNPVFTGGLLHFTVTGRSSKTLSIFTAAGKLLSTRCIPFNGIGRRSVDPFADVENGNGAGVYIVRISGGDECSSLLIYSFSRPTNGRSFSAVSPKALRKPTLSAGASMADSIRVGRTYFFPLKKPLSGYSQNMGDVTLVWFDVEARIDSVIAAAADSPHVYLNQCMMHNNWDDSAFSAEKAAGASFMAGDVKPAVAGDPRLAASYAVYMDSYKKAHWNSPHRIPFLIGYDAVHGVNMCDNTVIFPHNVGLGATRDTQLVQVACRVTAIEMAGTGCPWTFAPCIAVARNIGWGRTYESFGETPGLVSRMARAAIVGLQGFDLSNPLAVAACAKHFAGDGGTAKGTSTVKDAIFDRGNTATGSDQVLRAIHLAPYKAALDVGVASIMASFSQWNGVPMHANATLLTDWLKTQNRFQGWV
jgi:hypothetical protein